MVKRILLVVGVLVLAGGAAYVARDPERTVLDAAAREGVPGDFVTLGDGVTHYDVTGPDSGQRVLLVHGFSVPYYIWDSTVVALSAAGFRVARYDIFGRGWSDRPDTKYSVDLYDRQVLQLLDSLGWREPVDIVGLSMGGIVVGAFAGRHPERVRSVTMVDPAAGPGGEPPALMRVPLLGAVAWQMLQVPGMADGQFSDFAHPERWPDWADRYRVQMRYRGFGRALRRTILDQSGLELDTLYARVGTNGTRSLLIWGTEDQTVPIANAASVRTAIPHIEYHAIPDAGHLPHMERGDLVYPVLIGFLRGPTSADK